MSINNSVYIPSVEAKDLYNSNNLKLPNEIGYNLKSKDDKYNLKKFKNSLDYSLDLIKIREIYKKVIRNNKFSFKFNKKEYTKHIVNVNFSYSHKLFNKSMKNVYIKAGYNYKDLLFQDSVCIVDGELLGIEVEKEVISPIAETILGKNFYFKDGKYKIKGEIETLMTKSELRSYLYNNGFNCDGTHYVRFKRSSGSSRLGKCLFINEKLYEKIHKWELCGLKIKEGDEVDLAAFEAYIALTLSNIIDTIKIKPENILIVDDYNSVFEDEVVAVDYKNGELKSESKTTTISNSIFDGQSLMDSSLFEKYKDKGMLLLRNRFFKSACFNTNIQQYFNDNNITEISQLNGFTIADKIEDIKLITTPSSIKYIKFGTIKQWLKNIEYDFGIVKYEKEPKFFNGRMVQTHYQLLNTLQLSKKEMNNFLSQTTDYFEKIKNDPDILRYHIKYPYDRIEKDFVAQSNIKNEAGFAMMGVNSDFCKTKLYHEFKVDVLKSIKRDLKKGHVLVNGNYSILFGNGLEMLNHSIKKFNGESILGIGNIYSKRFKFGEKILGTRSPHINSGNILLVNNVYNEDIEKYFNLSKEIAIVNAIGENIQQRLNG